MGANAPPAEPLDESEAPLDPTTQTTLAHSDTPMFIEQIWLIPLMPLLAAIACGFAGRRLGEHAGTLATAGMFTTFLISARVLLNEIPEIMQYAAQLGVDGVFPVTTKLFTWMSVGPYAIDFAFAVDHVTAVMLLIVSLVGTLVFYYARGYMHGDEGYPRFFAYLSLFAFAMYILVLADNFLLLFVGWEGVGLCSYLLIGFWFKNGEYASAGKKAFIANRVGDFGMLLAMFLLLGSFGTLNFESLRGMATPENVALLGTGIFTVTTLCLLLAATGKSAQIPLFVWLPDAMAGPTPVSALIHAATMVTAGIYMIIRVNFLFALAPATMALMAIIGAATALMAGLIACAQRDIKKVLAYSTVSQLGYMFLALGVGAWGASLFHVYTHAFFKGCLFLCAGSVIHALHHEQDMKNMGGLKSRMPITAATYFISTLAIAGIFPMSGFFSKDEILWSVIGQSMNGFWQFFFHAGLWVVGLATAGLTAFYMFRSYYMAFEGESRLSEHNEEHVHESPAMMTRPLMILAFGAAVMGVLGMPGWLPFVPDNLTLLFKQYIAPSIEIQAFAANSAGHGAFEPAHSHAAEMFFAIVSLSVAGLGWWTARKMYRTGGVAGDETLKTKFAGLYERAAAKFSVDELYERTWLAWTRKGAAYTVRADRDGIDGSIIGTLVRRARATATWMRGLQNGQTQTYALGIVAGVNILLLIALFS